MPEEKLTRNQRERSRLVTAKLFDLWEEYDSSGRSTTAARGESGRWSSPAVFEYNLVPQHHAAARTFLCLINRTVLISHFFGLICFISFFRLM